MGVFYPSKEKLLAYFSQIFKTVEMDSTFYEKFYNHMSKGTFWGMTKATPEDFQFSVKVPETITHKKKMDLNQNAFVDLEDFLEKISPLKTTNKLGAIIFQLAPSFTVDDFKNVESFLDRLPAGYDYAVEFRHGSWQTEGPWEMLKHYNVSTTITDSPDPKLAFLSNPVVTTDHSIIRMHGRHKGYWYNYLYSKQELEPWLEKVEELRTKTKALRIYFNNHYGGKAVANALQFRKMVGEELTRSEAKALEKAEEYISRTTEQRTLT